MSMKNVVRGVVISKTIWLNVFLAVVSGLELMGSHLTTVLGPKWGAGLVMVGSLVNIGLRAYTTQSLAERGAQSIAKSDG